MRPTEAQHYHQQLILQEVSAAETLANASKIPTLRQIIYLHDCWRRENLSKDNPLSKIKEKISLYEENVCICHKFNSFVAIYFNQNKL